MSSHPQPIETDDLIVLLLGVPSLPGQEGRIEGITRLEKLVFLIEEERKPQWLSENSEFVSDKFGPFSAQIYKSVDVLAAAGLLDDSGSIGSATDDALDMWETENIIGEETPDPYATRNFELTERGRRYYDALINELPHGVEQDLAGFKQSFGGLPLRQLIRYVYERYPGFTDKSIIRDEIMR